MSAVFVVRNYSLSPPPEAKGKSFSKAPADWALLAFCRGMSPTPVSEPRVRAQPTDVAWGLMLCFTDGHLLFRKRPGLSEVGANKWQSRTLKPGPSDFGLDHFLRQLLSPFSTPSCPVWTRKHGLPQAWHLCQELGDCGEQVKPCFLLGAGGVDSDAQRLRAAGESLGGSVASALPPTSEREGLPAGWHVFDLFPAP